MAHPEVPLFKVFQLKFNTAFSDTGHSHNSSIRKQKQKANRVIGKEEDEESSHALKSHLSRHRWRTALRQVSSAAGRRCLPSLREFRCLETWREGGVTQRERRVSGATYTQHDATLLQREVLAPFLRAFTHSVRHTPPPLYLSLSLQLL